MTRSVGALAVQAFAPFAKAWASSVGMCGCLSTAHKAIPALYPRGTTVHGTIEFPRLSGLGGNALGPRSSGSIWFTWQDLGCAFHNKSRMESRSKPNLGTVVVKGASIHAFTTAA